MQKRIRRTNNFVYPYGPVDLTRPIAQDKRNVFVTDMLSAATKLEAWQAEVKLHPDDAQSPGDFDLSVIPDPNNYQMTREEIVAADAAFNSAVKNNEVASPPPFPYDPCMIDFCYLFNVLTVISRGRQSKYNNCPPEWNNAWGQWLPGLHLVNRGEAGFVRRLHAFNILAMIDNIDEHVVDVDGLKVIVGGGSKETSIPFIVNVSDRGNYHVISKVRNAHSLEKISGLSYLVGQLNSGPYTVHLPENSGQVTFAFPNQVMTLGYYKLNDKILSPNQLRKQTNNTNLKFVAIDQNNDSWRGNLIAHEHLVADVQYMDHGSEDDKIMTNALVQCRVHPDNMTCFGFRAFQVGIVPFYYKDTNGDVSFGTALGERTNIHLNKSMSREPKNDDAPPVDVLVNHNKEKV